MRVAIAFRALTRLRVRHSRSPQSAFSGLGGRPLSSRHSVPAAARRSRTRRGTLLGLDELAAVLQLGERVRSTSAALANSSCAVTTRLHHGLHLALQVVALVDHEGDVGAAPPRARSTKISWKMRNTW